MRILVVMTLIVLASLAGCAGTARMAIAGGDALGDVADEFETTIGEYHDEVSAGDTVRETAIAEAFVARVKRSPDDPTNVRDFIQAQSKIRQDRETEWDRRNAALDNVGVLREIAKGLNRVGLDSMNLNDEVRRYITSWSDGYQKYKSDRRAQSDARRAERKAQRDQLIAQGAGIITDALTPKPGGTPNAGQ